MTARQRAVALVGSAIDRLTNLIAARASTAEISAARRDLSSRILDYGGACAGASAPGVGPVEVLYHSPLDGRVHEADILGEAGKPNGLVLLVRHEGTLEIALCAEPGARCGQYRLIAEALAPADQVDGEPYLARVDRPSPI